MAEAVTLVGEKELLGKFKALHDFMDEGPIETAALKATKVVESDARRRLRGQGIKKKTGALEKSLRSERPNRKLKGFPGAFVTVGGKTAPHAHLIELGHTIVRGGRVVGQAPAYPFFRPALDSNRSRALAIIRRAAKKEVHKAAMRKSKAILFRQF